MSFKIDITNEVEQGVLDITQVRKYRVIVDVKYGETQTDQMIHINASSIKALEFKNLLQKNNTYSFTLKFD